MTSQVQNDNVYFWNRFAGKYDRFTARFAAGYPQLTAKITADIGPVERVLEVAAGTGIISLALARAAGRVDAVDFAASMVDIGRAKAADQGAANLFFNMQSAYGLEFPDESFDAAVCANALHIMEHPALALSEIHRVLKVGGQFIAPTYCHGEGFRAKCYSRLMHLGSRFHAYNRWTALGFLSVLETNGFKITGQELIPDKIPMIYAIARKSAHHGP